MFPKSDADWIEEFISPSDKNNMLNSYKDFMIQPEKIFYYIDDEDIAFRIKLNYPLMSFNSVMAENKIWGININDAISKNLLFSLQLNDTKEDCTIELLDKNHIIKASLKGKINKFEEVDDNIKITMIPIDFSNSTNSATVQLAAFLLDFKFPNKLIYKSLPDLVGKELNCYLNYYILDKSALTTKENSKLNINKSIDKAISAETVPSLDYVNSLVKSPQLGSNTVSKEDLT